MIDALREKAKAYELSAASWEERGHPLTAVQFATLAIAFYELAEVYERELEEAA